MTMHAMDPHLSNHIIAAMSRMFHFITGGITACTPTWSSPPRIEPAHKLYVPVSGAGFYDVGASERELTPGWIYLIPSGRRHTHRCPHRFTVRWVHLHAVDQALDRQLARLTDIQVWPITRWKHARRAWEGLDAFFPQRPTATDLRLQALLADLTAEALDTLPPITPPDLAARERLATAATWLDARACTNPSLTAAARQAGLSAVHFHRLATRTWGETPHARVQRIRLERARDLLRSAHELPVAQIAERCGFANPFYFTRAFAKRFGMPPTAYRQRTAP